VTAAEAFARHALGLEWHRLPETARRSAATFLHDTVCVGVAGVRAPYADAVLSAAAGWGAGEAASVLGRPSVRLPAASAAFVDAFQIHAQEFDCVHESAVVHPLATIASVLLAEAERGGPYTGREVLIALAAGVDVAAALGLAARSPLKFFRPATAGIFGCVAASARLRRLDLDTTLDALGYALAFASGTMQAHAEGKPALPLQIANAARGAVAAVDLAVAGTPGPRASIDGAFGYLALFETESDLAPVLEDLGRASRIAEVSWKPFPTGRAAHGGIVAVQRLAAEHGVEAGQVERLTYRAPPLVARLVGRPATDSMIPAYARLCLPYLAAVTLVRGTVGLGDFGPERLCDPVLRALAAKVSVEADANSDPSAFTPAVLVANLADGRTVEVRIDAQLGSPLLPLSPEQHAAKARACLTFAGFEAAHEPLVALFDRFADLEDATEIFRALHGARP
jgi:2-methylcitrate dehydratase PrpD